MLLLLGIPPKLIFVNPHRSCDRIWWYQAVFTGVARQQHPPKFWCLFGLKVGQVFEGQYVWVKMRITVNRIWYTDIPVTCMKFFIAALVPHHSCLEPLVVAWFFTLDTSKPNGNYWSWLVSKNVSSYNFYNWHQQLLHMATMARAQVSLELLGCWGLRCALRKRPGDGHCHHERSIISLILITWYTAISEYLI